MKYKHIGEPSGSLGTYLARSSWPEAPHGTISPKITRQRKIFGWGAAIHQMIVKGD